MKFAFFNSLLKRKHCLEISFQKNMVFISINFCPFQWYGVVAILYLSVYLYLDHSIHVNNSPLLKNDSSSSLSDFSLTNAPPMKSFYTDLWALGPAMVSSGQLWHIWSCISPTNHDRENQCKRLNLGVGRNQENEGNLHTIVSLLFLFIC